MNLYAHRGIDLDRPDSETSPISENSMAAFRRAAERGWGSELDLQITGERELIVAHDADVSKWTLGKHSVRWSELARVDLDRLALTFEPLATLSQIFALQREFGQIQMALHIKGSNQHDVFLAALVEALQGCVDLHSRLVLFDLRIPFAASLRRQFPSLGLAPSVSHDFDVQRFQSLAQGTLFSRKSVLDEDGPFNWVWLDEWDRLTVDGKSKDFYEDSIELCRNHGFKVALISPELHRSEKHPDGLMIDTLIARWQELLRLKPDAICTDYPARLARTISAG